MKRQISMLVGVIIAFSQLVCACTFGGENPTDSVLSVTGTSDWSGGLQTFTASAIPETPVTTVTYTETAMPLVTATTAQTPVPTPMELINVTQMPLDLPEATQGTGEYLYRDVKVTMKAYRSFTPTFSYINLDDLQDNGMENSDIEFYLQRSKSDVSDIYPTKYAKVYFANLPKIDFDICKAHLSEFMDMGAIFFWDTAPYCVLTNEGRIAVIQYIDRSYNYDEMSNIISFSLTVTVYNQKVIE